MTFKFEVIHQSKKSRARVGVIHTPHGIIETPSFVAVGTNGTLKAIDNVPVEEAGLQLMFCNTYHMMLQPGTEVVRKAGGLHKYIGRKAPIITDSGGFQVFSLAYGGVADELKSRGARKTDGHVLKINEEGVLFRSYRDGKKILLTAETSVDAQKDLGADIIIPFDELPPYHIDRKVLIDSFERTHRWEKRSLDHHLKNPNNQAMYSVVHGGVDPDLRKKSCHFANDFAFDGFAIGGSLGKTKQELFALLDFTPAHLDPKRPIHLLGIGDLESIHYGVNSGIDTFDSSYPTRAARHGIVITQQGPLDLRKKHNQEDFGPLDPTCSCTTCQKYSRAFLHHLFKASELTAQSLSSIHNIKQMVTIMANYRNKIASGEI